MFKEQLHTSFDSIRPAPELLDRISAMMSEEAAKPKKPIYMNAVKYGGIAAAVVIAAGATIAVVQNTNTRNIATEKTIAPTTTAAVAAVPETAAADNSGGSIRADEIYAGAEVPEDTTEVSSRYEEAAAEAAEEYIVGDSASADAAEGGEVFFATSTAPETYPAVADDYSQNDSDDDTLSMDSLQGEAYRNDTEEALEGEAPAAVMMIPEAIGAPQYEENNDECLDAAEAYPLDEEEACCEAEYMDEDTVSDMYSMKSTAADPATGGGNTMQFENPFIYRFYDIPKALQMSVEGIIEERTDEYGEKYTVMGEKWHEFIGKYIKITPNGEDEDVPPGNEYDPPAFRDITAIDEDFNIYTFIEYFNVPDDTAREALSGILTKEKIDVLLSGDETAITKEFASEYAIVKGKKIYAPLWLERYSTKEWKAAGITKRDIKEKYDTLSQIPYLREDLQKTIIEKMNEYIK